MNEVAKVSVDKRKAMLTHLAWDTDKFILKQGSMSAGSTRPAWLAGRKDADVLTIVQSGLGISSDGKATTAFRPRTKISSSVFGVISSSKPVAQDSLVCEFLVGSNVCFLNVSAACVLGSISQTDTEALANVSVVAYPPILSVGDVYDSDRLSLWTTRQVAQNEGLVVYVSKFVIPVSQTNEAPECTIVVQKQV